MENVLMRALLSILSILLIIFPDICIADDSVCNEFYNELAEIPHTKLEFNSDGFISMWGGKFIDGCEIVFESNESIVSGDIVYEKFESFIHKPEWVIDNTKCADGPGSSIVGIENDQNSCIVNWEQQAWIDENNEHRQSDEIKLIVQCPDQVIIDL